MSQLNKEDATLQDLLNAPKYPCEEKSCWNCVNSHYEDGDESVGLAGYVYCCLAEDEEFPEYELLQDYVERVLPFSITTEENLAQHCPHYKPEMLIGKCPISGKKLPNVPYHLHKYWGYDAQGNHYPVAGPTEVLVADLKREGELKDQDYCGQMWEVYKEPQSQEE